MPQGTNVDEILDRIEGLKTALVRKRAEPHGRDQDTQPEWPHVSHCGSGHSIDDEYAYGNLQPLTVNISTSAVPLPAALPLFAGGLGLMGWG